MCSNSALVESLECYLEELVECFEDFVKKSLIAIVVGLSVIIGSLFYLLRSVGNRQSVQPAFPGRAGVNTTGVQCSQPNEVKKTASVASNTSLSKISPSSRSNARHVSSNTNLQLLGDKFPPPCTKAQSPVFNFATPCSRSRENYLNNIREIYPQRPATPRPVAHKYSAARLQSCPLPLCASPPCSPPICQTPVPSCPQKRPSHPGPRTGITPGPSLSIESTSAYKYLHFWYNMALNYVSTYYQNLNIGESYLALTLIMIVVLSFLLPDITQKINVNKEVKDLKTVLHVMSKEVHRAEAACYTAADEVCFLHHSVCDNGTDTDLEHQDLLVCTNDSLRQSCSAPAQVEKKIGFFRRIFFPDQNSSLSHNKEIALMSYVYTNSFDATKPAKVAVSP